jgi:SAM-dependent methyltransferase
MRTTYRALYRLGFTPWDSATIPAPLVDITEGSMALSPGLAVDLGCGTGRKALFLAAHGWDVLGVDAVPQALASARAREVTIARGEGRINWRLADVTDPRQVDPDGRLAACATLLLDNGCLHGIPDRQRPGWAATVQALAASGCVLLISAMTRNRRGIGPIGLAPEELPALLGADWGRLPAPARDWYCYQRH